MKKRSFEEEAMERSFGMPCSACGSTKCNVAQLVVQHRARNCRRDPEMEARITAAQDLCNELAEKRGLPS